MSSILYNPISAQCTRVPCIDQVAGYFDHNPVAQLSACQSLFGVPVVATVTQTVPAGDIFSTRTSTQTDVVIVVTTSTAYSTAEQISTSYQTVYSTTTEYTQTITNTVSTTITAAPAPPSKNKRNVKRRGLCKHRSSSTSSSLTISDIEHVSSSTSSSPAISDIEHASSTTASSDQPPIPSNCPNVDEYSSACACVAPRTVTEYSDPTTSIIDETTTLTSASTIETILTVGVTTVIVKPATTTVPTTLQSQTTATATSTTTVTPIPTIFNVKVYGTDEYLFVAGNNQGMALQIGTSPTTGGLISLPAGSTTAAMVTWPTFQMRGWRAPSGVSASISRVIFQADSNVAAIAGTWSKATCGINTSSLPGYFYFYCTAQSGLWNRFFRCGSDVYLTNNASPAPGCVPIILTAVGV